jgi:2-haloacid dehalogenase
MAIAPTVALLDVNETLSDFNRLGDRFEEVGAPAQLMPTWFAATLRDGIALTASGEYAAFLDVARAVLRGLLSDHPRLLRPLEEAVEHVLTGIGTLPVQSDVPDGIRLLREAGMRVATLTNGAPAIARGLLERAGLEGLVERNIGVEEVGRWKPAPEPYRHACRAMGVEEAQAMLIAAHPWDVHGAKRAGLPAGWVNRHGQPYPEVFATPDVSAGDLPALARALDGG